MVDRSAALTEALRLIDAYRVLLRDTPQDYFETAERQQEAADILDEAQTLGSLLTGNDSRTFSDRFADAYAEIAILETKRIQGGAEDFDDDDIEDDEPNRRRNAPIVAQLVGGPLHGQSRNLEPLQGASGEGTPPKTIQLWDATGHEVRMVTYLRDDAESAGGWRYFHVDPHELTASLQASLAMDTPSASLTEALALLGIAAQEYKKRNDAGNWCGMNALNSAIVIAQNELTEQEQATFAERRAPVQKMANEAEDAASFDPDWDHGGDVGDDNEGDATARVNEHVTRYFPYLAHEFQEAGRPDLAERLLVSYQEHGVAVPLPTDLPDILAVGIELRLGTAFSADREWRIAEFIRNNPVLDQAGEAAHRIDALHALQQAFREAKHQGDLEQMQRAQADFDIAVRELGTGLDLLGLLAMLTSFDSAAVGEK